MLITQNTSAVCSTNDRGGEGSFTETIYRPCDSPFHVPNKPAEFLIPAVHLVSGCRRHQVLGVGVSRKEHYIKIPSTFSLDCRSVSDMNKPTA